MLLKINITKAEKYNETKIFFSLVLYRAFGMGTHIQKVLLYTFRLKPYKRAQKKNNNKRKKGRKKKFFFLLFSSLQALALV